MTSFCTCQQLGQRRNVIYSYVPFKVSVKHRSLDGSRRSLNSKHSDKATDQAEKKTEKTENLEPPTEDGQPLRWVQCSVRKDKDLWWNRKRSDRCSNVSMSFLIIEPSRSNGASWILTLAPKIKEKATLKETRFIPESCYHARSQNHVIRKIQPGIYHWKCLITKPPFFKIIARPRFLSFYYYVSVLSTFKIFATFLKWTQDRQTKCWKWNDFGFCYAKCASQIRSRYECAKHCEQQKWSKGKIQRNKGRRTWSVDCETRFNREGTTPEKTKQTAFYFYCEAVMWRIAESSECVSVSRT